MREANHRPRPSDPSRRGRGPVGVRAGRGIGPVAGVLGAVRTVAGVADGRSRTGPTSGVPSRRC
jgi:hypothetical protein